MKIGVDIVDVERLAAAIKRCPEMERRLFTPAERAFFRTHAAPAVHQAGSLAAKEAVMKALGLAPLVLWARRIEIERSRVGAPTAFVRRRSGEVQVEVSITHDAGVAVAVAVVDPPRRHQGEIEQGDLGPWLERAGLST